VRRPKGRGTGLATAVRTLVLAAGEGMDALAALAVGTGPGAFSSLRAGLAVADGLATALSIPVFGRSSAYAWLAPYTGVQGTPVLCLDSRRGEVYSRLLDEGRLPGALRRPADLAAWLRDEPDPAFLLVGEGAVLHEALFRDVLADRVRFAEAAADGPDAAWIARDVAMALARGEAPRGRPEPLYLRPPSDAAPRIAPSGVSLPNSA
jgi:tRNA threonylcarbamoyladenosine biosynthesis protein TsaB